MATKKINNATAKKAKTTSPVPTTIPQTAPPAAFTSSQKQSLTPNFDALQNGEVFTGRYKTVYQKVNSKEYIEVGAPELGNITIDQHTDSILKKVDKKPAQTGNFVATKKLNKTP